jgi:hypothetical protein
MVESAVAASRGPSLQRFFGPIKERRGIKIARVALARRLLSLAFYALRDEAGCRAYPVLAHPSRSTRARSPYGMASPDGRDFD